MAAKSLPTAFQPALAAPHSLPHTPANPPQLPPVQAHTGPTQLSPGSTAITNLPTQTPPSLTSPFILHPSSLNLWLLWLLPGPDHLPALPGQASSWNPACV